MSGLVEAMAKAGKPVEIARYVGKVSDVPPKEHEKDGVPIDFEREGGEGFRRLFPRQRLAATEADFPGATVLYVIFSAGPMSITLLSLAGPTAEEILAQPWRMFTDEELAELDSWKDIPEITLPPTKTE